MDRGGVKRPRSGTPGKEFPLAYVLPLSYGGRIAEQTCSLTWHYGLALVESSNKKKDKSKKKKKNKPNTKKPDGGDDNTNSLES